MNNTNDPRAYTPRSNSPKANVKSKSALQMSSLYRLCESECDSKVTFALINSMNNAHIYYALRAVPVLGCDPNRPHSHSVSVYNAITINNHL